MTKRQFDAPWRPQGGKRPTQDVRGFHGRAPHEMSTYPPGWRADPLQCDHSQFLDNEWPVKTAMCMDCGCEIVPGTWGLLPGGQILTMTALAVQRARHAEIFGLRSSANRLPIVTRRLK